MKHGGRRPGAGRKKGGVNSITKRKAILWGMVLSDCRHEISKHLIELFNEDPKQAIKITIAISKLVSPKVLCEDRLYNELIDDAIKQISSSTK